MKPFMSSFLGSLAAIWATIVILFGLMFLSLVMMAVAGISGGGGATVHKHSVLYINLSGALAEHHQEVAPVDLLLGGPSRRTATLNETVRAINMAADDDRITMLFLEANGAQAGMAQRERLIEALKKFKATGKQIVAYGDVYSTGDYFTAAAVADSLIINPEGAVSLSGIVGQNMFYKSLLDKLGVKMQVLRVGTYKSAVEPYIMDAPSEASVEQQRVYLDALWWSMRGAIAAGRGVSEETVDAWVSAMLDTQEVIYLLKSKVVDGQEYRHRMLERIGRMSGLEGDEVREPRLVGPKTYLAANPGAPDLGNHSRYIAVLHLEGEINDLPELGGISAERAVPHILDFAHDEDCTALVLNVNSPGGSAFASEQIWEAVQTFKQTAPERPVYAVMSDYAASGGYYISCGADSIFAQPMTLTGSIGIFGLVPDASGLLTDKLGVHYYAVSSHPQAELPVTPFKPMTYAQQTSMQGMVENGYNLFCRRVAMGRKLSTDSVNAIGQGRVWAGSDAVKIGLVDRLAGLDQVLANLQQRLMDNEQPSSIRHYPYPEENLRNLLMEALMETERSKMDEHLGPAADLYHAIERVTRQGSAPMMLQARMEPVTIQ